MRQENKERYREQYRILGLRIAFYRRKKEWTQEQLADAVGCNTSFIGQLESNNNARIHAPSLYMLFRIAEVLEITVSKLFEE